MADKKGLGIALLAGAGVGGFFLWKVLKKDEGKEGFVVISTPNRPVKAVVGSTVNVTAIGKNLENKSHLCFMKIINQGTGEVIATRQTSNVGEGLTKEFTFEFIMIDISFLRIEIRAGRIIDNEEKIDSKLPWTIETEEPEPGYPKEICRDPYCFTVYTQAQETQMNEFLGIVPEGAADIDTYLANLTSTQLEEWKNYWTEMWNSLQRQDIVEFVISKYNEYAGVVSAKINDLQITVS